MKPLAGGALLVLTLLSACAREKVWLKPGAGQAEFSQEKYACLQQSQQPASSAYVDRYGGSSRSNIITNGGLYDACMNARGWMLADKASTAAGSNAYNDAIQALNAEDTAICERADLQAFYKKFPCRAADPTLEQLANRSKISPEEKIALTKVRAEIKELNKKYEAANRQYNPQTGNALAENIAKGTVMGDKIALDFYEGRITRGEYNKRQLDAIAQIRADAQKIARGGN